jgi:ABC-type methionine transport system ATPase subunit
MATQVLQLNYPPSLAGQPIIQQLIRQFELIVNIRQAQITLQEGWIELEACGSEAEVDRAVDWLASKGIQVGRVT